MRGQPCRTRRPSATSTFCGLGNPLELLQAAHDFRPWRVREARLPGGDADFAHINVAARVERKAVRREELAGIEARPLLPAKPRDALGLRVDDGQTRPEIRDLEIDRHARPQLADDEV